MCSHPYEKVQVRRCSWGQTGPPEVAEESCRNTSSEIVTASEQRRTLTQDAYLRNLAHSSPEGVRVNVYTRNRYTAIKHCQLSLSTKVKHGVDHVRSLVCPHEGPQPDVPKS